MWVGHSCPTPLTLQLIFQTKVYNQLKINFKCVGQEGPTHTWHERDARAYIGV